MDGLRKKIADLPEPFDFFNGRRLPKGFALPDNILLFYHDFISLTPNSHLRCTLVIPQGEMCYLLGDIPVTLREGDVLIILPGQVRYLLPSSKCYARLFITFELAEGQAYMPQSNLVKFGENSGKHLQDLLEYFRRGDSVECAMELVRFITSLDRSGPPLRSRKFSPFAAKAFSFINSHLHEKPGVADIARKLNVSESHLRMVFRREVGMSMSGYLAMQCLRTARHLLLGSDKSIGEIAAECGFGSIYAFSAFFRKKTGVSPSRFRREKTDAAGAVPGGK